jgi:hypothetical protein
MKKHICTRYIITIFALIAITLCIPNLVFATEYTTTDQAITYDYYDTASESFKTKTLNANGYTLVTSSSTTWSTGFYVLGSNVDIQDRVKVDGDVTLILAGGNTLNCSKGIDLTGNNSLTICTQKDSTGTLNAIGEDKNSAIGSSFNSGSIKDIGTLVINGGVIYARSGDLVEGNGNYIGSGIGGIKKINSTDREEYLYGCNGKVSIYGGDITAISETTWDGMSHSIDGISSSSFQTGTNGTAIIHTNAISDKTKINSWSCITYLGNNITVYGDQTLTDDLTIQNDYTLNILTSASLTIDDNHTLVNNGTINVNGKLNTKTLVNNKTLNIETNSNLVASDTLNNYGELNVDGSSNCKKLLNSGNIENNNTFTCEDVTNNGIIYNNGTLSATGTIAGDGYVISTTNNVAWKNSQILTQDKLKYINKNGEKVAIPSEDAICPIIPSVTTWKKQNGKNTWYIVAKDQEIGPVKLEDDVNLLLLDGTTLKVNGVNENGGINASGHTLNIYAQSNNKNTGKLIVTAGQENWMAIGGENATINIYGGLIEAAYGENNSWSGIGGAHYKAANKITIIEGIIKTKSIGRGDKEVGNETIGLYAPVGSNAIIYTEQSKIGNTASTFNGILFLKKEGTVYGNQSLATNLTIEADETLTIPEGTTLKVPKDFTFTLKGKLVVNGYLENSGTITLESGCSIEGNGKVRINFDSTLSGTISDSYIEYQTKWDTDGDGETDDNTYTAKGTSPTHTNGSKDSTADTVYTFNKWSPDIVAATEPKAYKATFTSSVRKYSISLPQNPRGYTVNTTNELSLPYQASFIFEVKVSDGYSKANNFAVKINDNVINPETNGTYKVTITENIEISVEGVVENVLITSSDASMEYDGETIDVSNYFVIDKNADAVIYSIVNEGTTGEGTLVENILTVTKTGKFKIKALTEANQTYAKGEGIATLTIDNGVIQYTATDYNDIYDGLTHGIAIVVTSPEDTDITYSIDGINYDDNAPQFKNVDEKIVYYKIQKDNYNDIDGYKTVKISKRPITITAENQTVVWGQAINNQKYKVNNLVTGDSITNIKLVASTNELSSGGTIIVSDVVIKNNETDVTNNYDISLINGSLNIGHNSNLSPSRIEAQKGKVRYEPNETLNTDDLIVTAYYDDGYSEVVTDFTTNASKLDMNIGGYKDLAVSYTENDKTVTSNIYIYVSFKIIDGANSSWNQESNNDLTISGNGKYEDFKNIKIDGTIVDSKNYEVSKTPTTITLKASYLDSLDIGNHSFEITWKGGSADTSFEILKNDSKENIENNSGTSDSGVINNEDVSNGGDVSESDNSLKAMIWIALPVLLLIIFAIVLVIKKKKQK